MNKFKVSVIIRTCGRPHVLRNALHSLRAQEYDNLEIVVAEDGANVSEKLIREEFGDLNIVYKCTGEKKGRCVVGNLGLSSATGDYFNFLDDDDILLPNHVSLLCSKLQETQAGAVYAVAEEHQIRITNPKEYSFKVRRKLIRYQQPFNRLLLFCINYIPIQSIMFSRKLYDTCGGFDEQLEVLEDWDLWMRYAQVSDFVFVPVKTSVYYTPYKGQKKSEREKQFYEGRNLIFEKQKQQSMQFSVAQLHEDTDYILRVYNKKGIIFYMRKVIDFLLFRDL